MSGNEQQWNTQINTVDLNRITSVCAQLTREICSAAGLRSGDLFVVGCSSSEVLGERIGTSTSVETAKAIYWGIAPELARRGIMLAAQCCEHLNRALVVEEETMRQFHLEQVAVFPHPNAGGAFGFVCWREMERPVLVESLNASASAGVDIGGTLIGMHIHPVVVPLRLSISKVGEANVLCASRRPKYIGGPRAAYDDSFVRSTYK